jgi:hypothetical protein
MHGIFSVFPASPFEGLDMNRQIFAASVSVVLLAAGPALGQKKVPPPPKPTDSGPTLEVTLKFVQDKIAEDGKFTYSASVKDSSQPDVEWTIGSKLS